MSAAAFAYEGVPDIPVNMSANEYRLRTLTREYEEAIQELERLGARWLEAYAAGNRSEVRRLESQSRAVERTTRRLERKLRKLQK